MSSVLLYRFQAPLKRGFLISESVLYSINTEHMSEKLWKKQEVELHPLVEAYTVGEDYMLDTNLMLYDIEASKAHADGLGHIGILSEEEVHNLKNALNDIAEKFTAGEIKITIQDEDCHTVIESELIKRLGDTGKKIHTGRSRNDQVLTAMRLYMRAEIDEIIVLAEKLAKRFLSFAGNYQNVPLPGYTHTQQAMLSSVGHYMCSYVESLLDDVSLLKAIQKHINKNPLGSAAGFGVSLELDRAYTTKQLGFEATQINSLYCQNSKGKFESLFLEGLVQIMMTLNKFAHDMLIFTSKESDFFDVDDSLVTGSSIMPQKRNLDTMEILRANVSVLMSNQGMIQSMSKNLMSGYNRDLQLIKKPVMQGVELVKASLEVLEVYIQGMKPNQAHIESKIENEIFMADIATKLVKETGVPFRDAYKQAAEELEKQEIDMQENLASKVSLGAPGNLNMGHYRELLGGV